MTMANVTSRNLLVVLALALGGCGAGDSGKATNDRTPPAAPGMRQPVIVESDIYRLAGDHLFLQNEETGLNILDVAAPSHPKLVGRLPATAGSAGEMYVREAVAVVLLKSATSACRCVKNLDQQGWSWGSEVVFVDTIDTTNPRLIDRYCLPGTLVASRIVDDILYVVMTRPDAMGSRAFSINLADPRDPMMVQQLELADASKEILVTGESIIVASASTNSYDETRVQVISINGQGQMTPRGAIKVKGTPQGRFHMDAQDDQFRIVTYDNTYRQSRLTIVDLGNPDLPSILGTLGDIGGGEKLYATRFDGDRVYVVTFRQTDPLWIISLADPTRPTIVGALQVPGWSDFIFPRGDRLIAVGRGASGSYLGVSLFDVTYPHNPRSLHQVSLGSADGTSEANVDHRAVTILDLPGRLPLIVVPHTSVRYSTTSSTGCAVQDQLTLIDVAQSSLQVRGAVAQRGTIYRTLLVSGYLYSISDYEVLAVNFDDRDHPRADSAITVGLTAKTDPAFSSYCQQWDEYYTNWQEPSYVVDHSHPMFLCSVSSSQVGLPPLSLLIGLAWVVARVLRRRAR
jgi:hypothetical protein